MNNTPANTACFADINKAPVALHSGGGVNTRKVFTMTQKLYHTPGTHTRAHMKNLKKAKRGGAFRACMG